MDFKTIEEMLRGDKNSKLEAVLAMYGKGGVIFDLARFLQNGFPPYIGKLLYEEIIEKTRRKSLAGNVNHEDVED